MMYRSRFAIAILCLSIGLLMTHHVQSQSVMLTVEDYERHNEISFPAFPGADRYQIWRQGPNETAFSLLATTQQLRRQDWIGQPQGIDPAFRYFVRALNVPGVIIGHSDTIEVLQTIMDDEAFLDMTQQYTFRYFYEYGHPVSGMTRERLGSGDIVTTGGSGFGIMALLVGVHRGWITRDQGIDRLLSIVSFLQFADRFHGVFPHWMNGKTGDAIPFSTFDNGGDLVETAFLMQGLLCARQFFNEDTPKENAVRDIITDLWEAVEWDHYSRNDSDVLYWHWSPDFGWQMNFQIRGYNEALIVYLLAIASPTHPVEASYYHTGWAGGAYTNGNTWYGHKLFVGPHIGGPLFFAHYSFMGFDPRGKRDAYANYFHQHQNHTLMNRGWCVANPLHHDGYGDNTWGLTASDNPFGYAAHAPGGGSDNGTITPAAGIPSMPYTPNESLPLLKNLYRTYGDRLWGEYGFYDAFNLNEDWFADSYLAIDQGPIINMIENYRSGLLWDLFMQNEEITPALEAIGFVADSTVSVASAFPSAVEWSVYPTWVKQDLRISIAEDILSEVVQIRISDAIGRHEPLPILKDSDDHTMLIPLEELRAWQGMCWISIIFENGSIGTKPIWLP